MFLKNLVMKSTDNEVAKLSYIQDIKLLVNNAGCKSYAAVNIIFYKPRHKNDNSDEQDNI